MLCYFVEVLGPNIAFELVAGLQKMLTLTIKSVISKTNHFLSMRKGIFLIFKSYKMKRNSKKCLPYFTDQNSFAHFGGMQNIFYNLKFQIFFLVNFLAVKERYSKISKNIHF